MAEWPILIFCLVIMVPLIFLFGGTFLLFLTSIVLDAFNYIKGKVRK